MTYITVQNRDFRRANEWLIAHRVFDRCSVEYPPVPRSHTVWIFDDEEIAARFNAILEGNQ